MAARFAATSNFAARAIILGTFPPDGAPNAARQRNCGRVGVSTIDRTGGSPAPGGFSRQSGFGPTPPAEAIPALQREIASTGLDTPEETGNSTRLAEGLLGNDGQIWLRQEAAL